MLVTFCVYIFGMILIGFIACDQRKTLTTIFWAVVALGHSYGIIGGCVGYERLAVNGVAGAVFLSGISESWIAIGLTLGAGSTGSWWRGGCVCIPNTTISLNIAGLFHRAL